MEPLHVYAGVKPDDSAAFGDDIKSVTSSSDARYFDLSDLDEKIERAIRKELDRVDANIADVKCSDAILKIEGQLRYLSVITVGAFLIFVTSAAMATQMLYHPYSKPPDVQSQGTAVCGWKSDLPIGLALLTYYTIPLPTQALRVLSAVSVAIVSHLPTISWTSRVPAMVRSWTTRATPKCTCKR